MKSIFDATITDLKNQFYDLDTENADLKRIIQKLEKMNLMQET